MSSLYRLRITYGVNGPLRYVSHLEQVRVWERAMRRAGLPLAYTGGFTPRPRLQVALPLPLGFAAEAEWLDIWLERPVAPDEFRRALTDVLPEGLEIRAVEEVPPDAPALPARVQAAEYIVFVETVIPAPEVQRRIEAFLAATEMRRERRGRPYDLRPLVLSLHLEESRPDGVLLKMTLSAREGATGRPEEVLDALGLAGDFFQVTRRAIHTVGGKENADERG